MINKHPYVCTHLCNLYLYDGYTESIDFCNRIVSHCMWQYINNHKIKSMLEIIVVSDEVKKKKREPSIKHAEKDV